MIGSKFSIHEYIPDYVIQDAINEGDSIYKSLYTNKVSLSGGRQRNKYDIIKDTLLGKIGEHFLKVHFGYIDDDRKWHDLISPEGISTEVKTWRKEYFKDSNIDKELKRLRQKVQQGWFFSERLIVILFDEENFEIYNEYYI